MRYFDLTQWRLACGDRASGVAADRSQGNNFPSPMPLQGSREAV
jgi:hypothetical protein